MVDIAQLRPPAAGTARKPPSLAALTELLTDRMGASALGKQGLAIDCGEGRNVRVQLRATDAVISATLAGARRVRDEEHGTWTSDDDADAPLLEVAASVAELLQDATGWHVQSEHLLDFEPAGRCACRAELFAWQTQCGACRRPVPLALDPSFPDDYEAPLQSLFTLEAPDEETRSPWEGKVETARVPELLALLRGHPNLRVEQASLAAASLILRLGRRSRDKVLLTLTRASIRLASPLRSDASPSPEAQSAARALAEILQGATGWAVTPSLGPHFQPCGTCPSCKRVVFRWQAHCARCGHRDLPRRTTMGEELARSYVAIAAEKGALRLHDDTARHAAEQRVAAELHAGRTLEAFVTDALRGAGAELLDFDAAARLYAPTRKQVFERLCARG